MELAKNVEEFIAKQRAAVAKNPECGVSRYNLAIGLLGLKKFDEAERELQAAIMNSPNLAEAYVQLGGICLQRGDMEGCLAYNRQAVNSRAGFSEGYGNIGFIELQRGNIDAAIYALEKAVRWNPKFVQALTTLGNAYLMKGMVDESIDMNLRALNIEENFAVAHNNLAVAYLEKGHYEEAARHFEKAKALGYEVASELEEEIEKNR